MSKKITKSVRRGRPKGIKNKKVSVASFTRLLKKTGAARAKLKKLEKALKKMALKVAG